MPDKDRKLVVEIDLGEWWTEDGTIAERIADMAAARLLRDAGDAKAELERRIKAVTDAEVVSAIKPLIAEAIKDGSVQLFNEYGSPKGSPQPLREYVIELVKSELKKPTGNSYDRQRQGLLARLVHEEVETALRRELEAEVKQAKADVLAAVRSQASEVIAATIERMAVSRA